MLERLDEDLYKQLVSYAKKLWQAKKLAGDGWEDAVHAAILKSIQEGTMTGLMKNVALEIQKAYMQEVRTKNIPLSDELINTILTNLHLEE